MGDTASNSPDAAGARKPRYRRKRFWFGLFLIFAAIGLAGLVLSATGVSVSVPDWATRKLEDRINAEFDAGRVSIRDVRLMVDPTGRPRVRMNDVGLYDRRGVEMARLNELRVRFAARDLMRGQATMKTLRLSGAQITMRRRTNGEFDLSLGDAGAGATGDLAAMLDGLDRAFADPALEALDEVTADQVTITLEDSRSGRIWQVTDGEIKLKQSEDSLDLTVSADVFNGTEELATAVIGFTTEKGSPKASLTATFENAAAADIAAQSPVLSFLSLLDAPISGALRATLDAEGTLDGLAGTLEVGGGVVQPEPGTRPIVFDGGRAYVAYDAADNTIALSQVSVQTGAARAIADGRAFLGDFEAGWPATLVGQFSLADVEIEPEDVFSEPMRFAKGAVDFRLRLDPFAVEVGQVALINGDQRFSARGRILAERTGWDVAMDVGLNSIPLERMLALWPVAVVPGTRKWLSENIISGEIADVTAAVRLSPGAEPQISLNYAFSGADVKFMRTLPPITGGAGYATLQNTSYTTVIEAGEIAAPNGGAIDVAGSVFHIADVTRKPGRAEITLRTDSSITAALSLLDLPPFELMTKASLATDLAEGRAVVRSDISFDLLPVIELPGVSYSVAGDLLDVTSDKLVPKHPISADSLSLSASREGITIEGPGRFGTVPVTASWSQEFGPESRKGSRIEGTVELSQTMLDEFDIGLPPGSVSGKGVARIAVDLRRDAPPVFALSSDTAGVGLSLAAVNWSKSRKRKAALEISGRLGKNPAIDRLSIDAPGLKASGVIDLTPAGGLARAQFDRVRLGGWLDGPVTLRGRGPGRTPGVVMGGGTIDLRRATLGTSGGGRGGGGPIALTLNRLTISEGISLTSFRGEFRNDVGLDGTFTGRVNGGTPIRGTLVPTRTGSAVRILSDDAGGAIASAGILRNARGGSMQLTLNPTGADGTYRGQLTVRGTRIIEAPAMTDLLSAISIVGLLDQMNSGGITMSEVTGEFQLTPNRLTLYRSSAVGPSIGVSLDGYVDLQRELIDMQGVISPVYFLNGIGQIFSRRGEGLFGFNFRLTGAMRDPNVAVNPLSILTPGMFREIFRRAPPQPRQ